MVWRLMGTENQNRIVQNALDRCSFPFDLLKPGLSREVGRDYIPVEWTDLSMYAVSTDSKGNKFVKINGDEAHAVQFREQTLGLAWYSGKVSIEKTLEANPELAGEVFISEGAHMVDFFYMTDIHRQEIIKAYHNGLSDEPEHGWFDVSDYRAWVGESFMGGFTQAYTDFPVTISFTHESPESIGPVIREILTPTPVIPVPTPTTSGSGATPYFSGKNKKIYHDVHKGIVPVESFEYPPSDRAPCKVCKPRSL